MMVSPPVPDLVIVLLYKERCPFSLLPTYQNAEYSLETMPGSGVPADGANCLATVGQTVSGVVGFKKSLQFMLVTSAW